MKINEEELKRRLPDYLKGNLSDSEKKAFERQIAAAENKAETESLIKIWSGFVALPDAEPEPTLQIKFDAMVQVYKAGQAHGRQHISLKDTINNWLLKWWPKQPVLQLGGAFALLFVGILVGYLFQPAGRNSDIGMLRNEVADLRQIVAVSLLQSQSPAERLRGITYSYDVQHPSSETLQALLNTLNYDPNLNVRLAAVDALSIFYGRKIIRDGVQASLQRQTSPLLQIALIDLLSQQRERRAVGLLDELQNNRNFPEAVRQHAGKAIEKLK